MTEPVLLIHGGAWAMPDDAVAAHERGLQASLTAGWEVLRRGGSSLDAVEASISVMEDDDTFDAGRGSFLTSDARVQLDALIMSGADLRAGGVACVERLRNPIQAARLVLDRSPHVYFVGKDAEAFAEAQGMPLIHNADLVLPRERQRLADFQQAQAAGQPDLTFAGSPPPSPHPHTAVFPSGAAVTDPGLAVDPGREALLAESAVREGLPESLRIDDPTLFSHDTVGALALDMEGNLAAGTSTGGTLSKTPGRVGDSSLIGCGCYADNASAAVSLTGWGEPIMKLVLGKWAVDRVASGTAPQNAAQTAAQDAIHYLYTRLRGHGGIILLNTTGHIGIAHNTPRMAWGVATSAGTRLGTRHTS